MILHLKCQKCFQLHFTNYHKGADGKYLIDLDIPNIEWCKTVEGFKANPFVQGLMGAAESIGEAVFEFCHRTGEMKLQNVSYAKIPFVAGWPSGDFRTVYKFYDDLDDNIFNVSHNAIIKH